MVTVSSNPNPTNPTTKYRSEFVNLFCIYALIGYKRFVLVCHFSSFCLCRPIGCRRHRALRLSGPGVVTRGYASVCECEWVCVSIFPPLSCHFQLDSSWKLFCLSTLIFILNQNLVNLHKYFLQSGHEMMGFCCGFKDEGHKTKRSLLWRENSGRRFDAEDNLVCRVS